MRRVGSGSRSTTSLSRSASAPPSPTPATTDHNNPPPLGAAPTPPPPANHVFPADAPPALPTTPAAKGDRRGVTEPGEGAPAAAAALNEPLGLLRDGTGVLVVERAAGRI